MAKQRILIISLLFILLVFGYAQTALALGYQGTQGGGSTVGGTQGAGGIQNPLGVDDPREIIGNIIRAILGIVGSLALAVFIFGGFTWVTSAGNDEKIKKGKDMITWAAFGLVAIFLSYALVTFVITALTGGSSSATGSGSPGGGIGQQSS